MTTGETKYVGQGGVLCWKTLLGVPRRQVMYMPVTLGGKSSGCGAQPGQRPKEPQSFRKPERHPVNCRPIPLCGLQCQFFSSGLFHRLFPPNETFPSIYLPSFLCPAPFKNYFWTARAARSHPPRDVRDREAPPAAHPANEREN